ncbi:MAG: di-trans,poly-cis-decaprenylcistransferase, partial [Clostridia bacterium]|nr:di-trans,poly-cis-decaprenylcistransferase [Clostridia bacterium]
AGSSRFVETVDICNNLGVEYLTVYALSTENWSRDSKEIAGLMEIMHDYIKRYVPELKKKNIRLRLLGDLSYFDEESRISLEKSVDTLKNNTGMTLCIALSYGGRHEIVQAVNAILKSGEKEIDEKSFEKYLYSSGIPDPDLIIRTSGEQRISNFLLWQSAYSEYYFTNVYWPDFDEKELDAAIDSFNKRNRRYGK